jgi:D-glycero-alpha-D-manno-heptose-7-phosphate kinase
MGGFNLVEFRTETDIIVNRVTMSPQRLADFENHLFIVFTGIKRKAANVVEKQLKRVSDNTATLKLMRQMVDQGWEILTSNRCLSAFGQLLDEAWQAKRSLDRSISNPDIDHIYRQGRAAGAWGGKLLGAGAGGFMLFFAPPEVHGQLAKTFANHQILAVKINAPGSQIIFS